MRYFELLLSEARGSVPLADTAQTEISRADWYGTHIAFMSPDQYIALARSRSNPPPFPSNLGGNIDKLQASIQQHGLRALPWLSINDGHVTEQEGLHRVIVLKNMGFERIPVRIFAAKGGERLDQDEAGAAYHALVLQKETPER